MKTTDINVGVHQIENINLGNVAKHKLNIYVEISVKKNYKKIKMLW